MCRAIEDAHSVDEVKDLRDKADALRLYAIQAKNKALEFKASEIRIRAERRAGELLQEMPKHAGGNPNLSSTKDRLEITLRDLGINRNQSSAWQKLAALPAERFEAAITQAVAKGKPPHNVIRALVVSAGRDSRQGQIANETATGLGPWAVVYADPPWPYSPRSSGVGVDSHYDTLEQGKIESFLKDRDIQVNDDAVLYLWATAPLLPQALAVMKAWGFEFKSPSVWDKQRGLPGSYFMIQTEFLLMGIRGKFPPPANTTMPNLVSIKRSNKHSEKPEWFRTMIEQHYPAFGSKNRLELFARQTANGWASMIEGKFEFQDSAEIAMAS